MLFLTKRYIFAKIEDSTMPTTDMTPSEFGRLFITRRDSFIKIARSYVRDQAIAEDIVSECFTLFWDKHESIDLKASPEAYIMKSVKNRCLNYLRDNAKIMHSEGSIDPEVNLRIKSMLSEISVLESSDMGEIFSSEVEGIFRKFLADMSELSRNIFISSRFEDLTYEDLGYGGYLVYCGRFNAGQLVEYIGYFEAIVWPIMAVSMLIEKTSRGKASLNRITELLDAPIDVADRPGVPDLKAPKGGIEFRNLTFRYPDGEFDVLKNISFKIEPGESVGIVGKTGAGKTALVDLLLRTYNVPDGTLFVDGQDVNRVSIHSVRNACAYVPQDNFLFSDTIAHNIAFGVDDATQEDIERAASLADVRDNIVDFKDGYETVLGERGVTVSGGQKQRISIARALLKNAPILILDDSVSAVDTRTEKIILDNLKTSRAGKTTLLIAHRISTVERLDKIIFLEDGAIEAVGPHDALYASCEEYRRMVDLQRLEDETGGDAQ